MKALGLKEKHAFKEQKKGRGPEGSKREGETGRGRGVTVGLLREFVGREADGKARRGGSLSSGMM